MQKIRWCEQGKKSLMDIASCYSPFHNIPKMDFVEISWINYYLVVWS